MAAARRWEAGKRGSLIKDGGATRFAPLSLQRVPRGALSASASEGARARGGALAPSRWCGRGGLWGIGGRLAVAELRSGSRDGERGAPGGGQGGSVRPHRHREGPGGRGKARGGPSRQHVAGGGRERGPGPGPGVASLRGAAELAAAGGAGRGLCAPKGGKSRRNRSSCPARGAGGPRVCGALPRLARRRALTMPPPLSPFSLPTLGSRLGPAAGRRLLGQGLPASCSWGCQRCLDCFCGATSAIVDSGRFLKGALGVGNWRDRNRCGALPTAAQLPSERKHKNTTVQHGKESVQGSSTLPTPKA